MSTKTVMYLCATMNLVAFLANGLVFLTGKGEVSNAVAAWVNGGAAAVFFAIGVRFSREAGDRR
jgi:hypothetical protein